jgi:hypothetical protein
MRVVTEPRAVASGLRILPTIVRALLISGLIITLSPYPARYRSRFCTGLKGSK